MVCSIDQQTYLYRIVKEGKLIYQGKEDPNPLEKKVLSHGYCLQCTYKEYNKFGLLPVLEEVINRYINKTQEIDRR